MSFLVPRTTHARRFPTRSYPGISFLLALGASFLLAACGSDGITGPEPVGRVDARGGTVQAQSGQVVLDFPPGAVSTEVGVTVEPAQGPPRGEGLLPGSAFDFGPDGIRFDEPVTLTIQFEAGELPADGVERGLAIHRAVGDGWQRIPGSVVDEGANRVTARIDGFSVYAVLFPGAPGEVVTTGGAQASAVGQAVAVPPSVRVLAEDGEPLSGLEVRFSVREGGGTVSGARQVTDGQGRATVGSWILGTTIGSNRLEARIEALETPVFFDAKALAGPPATLVEFQGGDQSAAPGTSVAVPPAVRVADEFDNPVSGVEVTFSADAGGSVEPGTVASGDDGVAAVRSWTLGEAGENSLTATAAGLDPAVFTATAGSGCELVPAISLGETVEGELAETDCQLESGRLTDKYGFSIAGQTAFSATLSAEGYSPVLFTFLASGPQVHGADGSDGAAVTVDYVLAPGSYELWPSSVALEPVTGAYSLATRTVAGDPTTGCARLALVVNSGVTVNGAITDGDCVVDFLDQPDVLRRFDHYAILVFPGETATATLSAGHEWALSLLDDGAFVTEIRNQPPGSTSSISYSPTETSFLVFTHWNDRDGETGSYTVSFDVSGASSGGSLRAPPATGPLLIPGGAHLPRGGSSRR